MQDGKNPKRKWIAGGATHTATHLIQMEHTAILIQCNCVLKNMIELFDILRWNEWKTSKKGGREKACEK